MFDKNMPLIKEEHYLTQDIKEFFLEATYEKITINISGKDKITVRQYGEPSVDKEYTCSFGNGILNLNFPKRRFGIFDFSLFRKNIEIEIEMPLKYHNAVKLNATSGSIRVNGHPSWSDVNIENKSEKISIQKIECSNLSLKSCSGSINLSNFATVKNQSMIKTTSGSIRINELKSLRSNIEARSGSIHLSNIETDNELLLSTNSGSIKAERVNCGSFNVNLTSGSLHLNYLNGFGNVFTNSGSVKIRSFKMNGNTSINTSSGSVYISLAPTQNYSLNIKTSSGSIHSRNPLYYEGNLKNRAAVTIGDGSSGTLSASTISGSVHIS